MRTRGRRALKGALAVGALACALLLGSSAYVELRYAGRIYPRASAPPAPVALVFGAGLSPKKAPSAVLAERLDAAIALYHAGKVQKVLLSGDNLERYHDETEAMRRYIIGKGVPEDRLLEDDAGLSTFDSCYRAVSVFGVRRALLITQDFHLPRALFIANSLGLDADGVPADEHAVKHAQSEVRELFSRAWAFVSVHVRGRPVPPER